MLNTNNVLSKLIYHLGYFVYHIGIFTYHIYFFVDLIMKKLFKA